MSIYEEVQRFAHELSGKLEGKKGVFTLIVPIAERKALLRKDRLEYIARFRIDDTEKVLHFAEMLKEEGSGVSADFGFQKELSRTTSGPRSGTIEEQLNLFGAKYEYRFDYKATRKAFEEITQKFGYRFEYHVSFSSV